MHSNVLKQCFKSLSFSSRGKLALCKQSGFVRFFTLRLIMLIVSMFTIYSASVGLVFFAFRTK